MNTEYLFIALSKTLLESCGQALLVWLAVKAFSGWGVRLSSVEASKPKNHYLLKYSAFVLVFISFIVTLLYHITHAPILFQPLEYAYLQTTGFVQASANTESGYQAVVESFLGIYSRWITLFYIAGLAIHAIWLLTSYLQVRNMANHSSHQKDDYWANRLEKLASKLGITRKVKFYLSGINEIPFTTGYLKPIILFPLAAVNQLTLAQVEAILIHELAHIKRNDYLFNLIQQVMKTFLFFNPFARLIERDIQREREYCCDDIVVAHSGDPETYASALLILEESRSTSPAFALACNNKTKYPLLHRIKRMIMTTPNSSSFPKLPIAILTLAIVLSVAWAIPGSGLKKHDKQPDQKSSIFKGSSVIIPEHEEFIALPGRSLTKKNPVRSVKADTILPAKKKIKIVIEDEKGTKTEYNSVDEMPEDVKEEFLKSNFKPGTINKGFRVFAKQLPDTLNQTNMIQYEVEFEPFMPLKKKSERLKELKVLEEKEITFDTLTKKNTDFEKSQTFKLTSEYSASQLKRLQSQLKQKELKLDASTEKELIKLLELKSRAYLNSIQELSKAELHLSEQGKKEINGIELKRLKESLYKSQNELDEVEDALNKAKLKNSEQKAVKSKEQIGKPEIERRRVQHSKATHAVITKEINAAHLKEMQYKELSLHKSKQALEKKLKETDRQSRQEALEKSGFGPKLSTESRSLVELRNRLSIAERKNPNSSDVKKLKKEIEASRMRLKTIEKDARKHLESLNLK